MIKIAVSFVLIVFWSQAVNAQNWSVNSGPPYIQFVTPDVFFGADNDWSAGVWTVNDSSWSLLQRLPWIDSFHQGQGRFDPSYEFKENYSTSGLYFPDPSHGFLFGQEGYGYIGNSYPYNTYSDGSWTESTNDGGKTWSTVNNSVDGPPAMQSDGWVYMLQNSVEAPEGMSRFNVRTMELDSLFQFDNLNFPFSKYLCGEMDTERGLIAVVDTSSQIHLLITENHGLEWEDIDSFSRLSDTVYFITKDSIDRLWIGRKNGVYVSTDFGTSWSLWSTTRDPIIDIAFASPKIAYGITTADDYVIKLEDSGKHWFGQRLLHSFIDQVTALDSNDIFLSATNGGENYYDWQSYYQSRNGGGSHSAVLHFKERTINLGINPFQDTSRVVVTAYSVGSDTLIISAIHSSNIWASIQPDSFRLAPGDSLNLEVSYYSGTGLLDTAKFTFETNTDGGEEDVTILNQGAAPFLYFEDWLGSNSEVGIDSTFWGGIVIENAGGAELSIYDVQSLTPGLRIDSFSISVAANSYGQFTCNLPISSGGQDSGQIVIYSNSIKMVDTFVAYWYVQAPAAVNAPTTQTDLFHIWPNPSNGEFHISSSDELSFQVFDMLGRLCSKFTSIGDNYVSEGLGSGIYLIVGQNSSGQRESITISVQ